MSKISCPTPEHRCCRSTRPRPPPAPPASHLLRLPEPGGDKGIAPGEHRSNPVGLSIPPAWGAMGPGSPAGRWRPEPLDAPEGNRCGMGRGARLGRQQPLHVRGQAAKLGRRENKTLFPSVRSHQSGDTRRPQQRRPCLSATQPRGEGREEEVGCWCLLRLVCWWVFSFFFVFCQKICTDFFFFGEPFAGLLGCQAYWQHIWPEPLLSSLVRNSRISTQSPSFVQLKPRAGGPVQSPGSRLSLEALQTHVTCHRSFPSGRGRCCFVLFFACYCLAHVAFSLGSAGGKGVSPLPGRRGRDVQASALPLLSPSSSSLMASPTSWWPATRTRAWRTRCWSVSTAGRRSCSWTGRRS